MKEILFWTRKKEEAKLFGQMADNSMENGKKVFVMVKVSPRRKIKMVLGSKFKNISKKAKKFDAISSYRNLLYL